jgi:hypothetical protein
MIKNDAEQVKAAIYKANGLIRVAAGILAVSPQGLRQRINHSLELQDALKQAREGIVDKAEESLWSCIEKDEPWAVSLVLKTLGKNRGYVERQELTGADSGPVLVKVIYDKQP